MMKELFSNMSEYLILGGVCLGDGTCHYEWINAAVLSSDIKQVLTGSGDKTAKLHCSLARVALVLLSRCTPCTIAATI